MVSGAIRTDLVLSAEIMVIALNEVAAQPFVSRAVILVAVAIALTVLVYGVVGMIVKMDDLGLSLTARKDRRVQLLGRALVSGIPTLLAVISAVGTAAMLWVGGHILLQGVDELGWHAPYQFVHHLQEQGHHAVHAIGPALGWLVNTAASATVGLAVGAVAVAVMQLLPFRPKSQPSGAKARAAHRTRAARKSLTLRPRPVPNRRPRPNTSTSTIVCTMNFDPSLPAGGGGLGRPMRRGKRGRGRARAACQQARGSGLSDLGRTEYGGKRVAHSAHICVIQNIPDSRT